MAPSDNLQRSEQRHMILRYLEQRPNAGDTAEGVLQWWLPLQRHIDTQETVQSILEELAAEGLVVRNTLLDGRVVYSAAASTNRNDAEDESKN